VSESPNDLTYRQSPARRDRRALLLLAVIALVKGSYSEIQRHQKITRASSCAPVGHCYRSTEQIDFPRFDNVYPGKLGDCLFASAADWRIIVRHQRPSSAEVIADYHRATAGRNTGLDTETFSAYWIRHGIAGHRIHGLHTVSMTSTADVESAVRKHRALIVVFLFHAGDTVGGDPVSAGGHAAIVDGYSPKGPFVVTWGTTYQMKWSEYWTSARSLYAVEG